MSFYLDPEEAKIAEARRKGEPMPPTPSGIDGEAVTSEPVIVVEKTTVKTTSPYEGTTEVQPSPAEIPVQRRTGPTQPPQEPEPLSSNGDVQSQVQEGLGTGFEVGGWTKSGDPVIAQVIPEKVKVQTRGFEQLDYYKGDPNDPQNRVSRGFGRANNNWLNPEKAQRFYNKAMKEGGVIPESTLRTLGNYGVDVRSYFNTHQTTPFTDRTYQEITTGYEVGGWTKSGDPVRAKVPGMMEFSPFAEAERRRDKNGDGSIPIGGDLYGETLSYEGMPRGRSYRPTGGDPLTTFLSPSTDTKGGITINDMVAEQSTGYTGTTKNGRGKGAFISNTETLTFIPTGQQSEADSKTVNETRPEGWNTKEDIIDKSTRHLSDPVLSDILSGGRKPTTVKDSNYITSIGQNLLSGGLGPSKIRKPIKMSSWGPLKIRKSTDPLAYLFGTTKPPKTKKPPTTAKFGSYATGGMPGPEVTHKHGHLERITYPGTDIVPKKDRGWLWTTSTPGKRTDKLDAQTDFLTHTIDMGGVMGIPTTPLKTGIRGIDRPTTGARRGMYGGTAPSKKLGPEARAAGGRYDPDALWNEFNKNQAEQARLDRLEAERLDNLGGHIYTPTGSSKNPWWRRW